ncbi:hypothetical protein NHX12_010634 [Muraenolepis orangiensis]|uniref:J domain-containing protein n=1 Tax=Muraenolepis orangiensis TaxID=630683 RepID=A0A9Q0DK14_9TELE|nr:hypothetical protein NHX12_010634 [Muraenolepis orangiensis]
MGIDYYAVLDLNPSATDTDINLSYRRLALKNHPSNRPEAGDVFRELAEAYDVLSDLRKKATYDKFGEEVLKAGVPQLSGEDGAWISPYIFHGNPHQTFRLFFGEDNPFAERDVSLTLDDLYHGCTKKIKISRKVINEDGYTSSIQEKILIITVMPGWNDGTRVTFPEEGDQGPNSVPADIVFIVRQKTHPWFTRQQNNLVYKAPISLEMALTGFSVDVETLDGRLVNIPVNDIVHPGYSKLVPGEGMPLPQDPALRGDLILTFDTQFPQKISTEMFGKVLVKDLEDQNGASQDC